MRLSKILLDLMAKKDPWEIFNDIYCLGGDPLVGWYDPAEVSLHQLSDWQLTSLLKTYEEDL